MEFCYKSPIKTVKPKTKKPLQRLPKRFSPEDFKKQREF